jgi:hypothetical protein
MIRRPRLPFAFLAMVVAATLVSGCSGMEEEEPLPARHAGLAQAEARAYADQEATTREREVGASLEFEKLSAGSDEAGRDAWIAVYHDLTDEYADLCVYVRDEPADDESYWVESGSCSDF